MPLTGDEFRKAKTQILKRDIEGLGEVCFRVIGGDELHRWTKDFEEDDPKYAQRFGASCVVEEDGTRIFEDDALDDFLSYPLTTIVAVTTAALAVNGLESGELDDMGKDSGAETNGEHGSG